MACKPKMLLPTITNDTITFNYLCEGSCEKGGGPCNPTLEPDFERFPGVKLVGRGSGPAGAQTTIRPTEDIKDLTVHVRCRCGNDEEGGEDHYTIIQYSPGDDVLIAILTLGISILIRVLKKELLGDSAKKLSLSSRFERSIGTLVATGEITDAEATQLRSGLRSEPGPN